MDANDIASIHQLVALYGHVIDDRMWDDLDRVFTEDAVYDVSCLGAGVVKSIPAIREWMSERTHPLAHFATNIVVQEKQDGTATVLSKGLILRATGAVGHVIYRDIAVKTGAGWRLAERAADIRV